MELEFDKEINAILRKARDSGVVAVTAVASPHADADSIAAFAENALPDKAKLLYMEHFADCDSCREQLSQLILMNSEADATTASSVAAPVDAAPAVSWFESIFKLPNFALAMGALVVLFAGGLGYLAIQSRNSATDGTISKVTEPRGAAPASSSNSASLSSNTTAANTSAAANAPSNASESVPGMPSNSASNAAARPGGPNTGVDKETTTDGVAPEADKPAIAAAAPPPAPVMDQPKTEPAKKSAVEEKMKDDSRVTALASRDEVSADRKAARELPTQNKRNDGPSRASGQVQQENNVLSPNTLEPTTTKQAGGKKFNLRDGVWYDISYHGQPTTDLRRGTDDYQKLDGSVRKIVDSIGGTVVVVWKSKAYRIR